MKNIIVIFAVSLLTSQLVQGQGTVYISNLGQSSGGNNAIGSNSWMAATFGTGNNVNGYALDSIQLGMANSTGNPSNFTVMVYNTVFIGGALPGSSLATLSGSTNPSTAGTYTYAPSSSFILSPNTIYFIVLTAGTAVINGAFLWSYAGTSSYNATGNWAAGEALVSNNGTLWNLPGAYPHDYPQFAITAEAVPEPGVLSLFILGGLGVLWRRQKF